MSIALFLLMPAVLVIGTLVLICRKIIFRTFVAKYKKEQPDSFDPESLSGVRLWDGNAHHQYHDLRQRSNSAAWHSEFQIPPFHPPHQPHVQPYPLPLPPQVQQSANFIVHQHPMSVQTDTPAAPNNNFTSTLPRPGVGNRIRGSKPPSPSPMKDNTKLTSSSIDSADVYARPHNNNTNYRHFSAAEPLYPVPTVLGNGQTQGIGYATGGQISGQLMGLELGPVQMLDPANYTCLRSFQSTIPNIVVSRISTPTYSPLGTQPSTPTYSPVQDNHRRNALSDFIDPEEGSMSTGTLHTASGFSPCLDRADSKSAAYSALQLKNMSADDFFGEMSNTMGESAGDRMMSKSADYADVKSSYPPFMLPVVQAGGGLRASKPLMRLNSVSDPSSVRTVGTYGATSHADFQVVVPTEDRDKPPPVPFFCPSSAFKPPPSPAKNVDFEMGTHFPSAFYDADYIDRVLNVTSNSSEHLLQSKSQSQSDIVLDGHSNFALNSYIGAEIGLNQGNNAALNIVPNTGLNLAEHRLFNPGQMEKNKLANTGHGSSMITNMEEKRRGSVALSNTSIWTDREAEFSREVSPGNPLGQGFYPLGVCGVFSDNPVRERASSSATPGFLGGQITSVMGNTDSSSAGFVPRNSLLRLNLKDLALDRVLGGGAFGQVWQGTWRGTPVAVKVLSAACQSNLPAPLLKAFIDEVEMLSSLRHPNICLYMAACIDPPNRAIVTELVSRGSLWEVLRTPGLFEGYPTYLPVTVPTISQGHPPRPPVPLVVSSFWPPWVVRRVLDDTLRGLVYLHSHDPPIIHRDLKSANLLLDDSFHVKICDFGLARLRDLNTTMTANVGTVQWMAPEVLKGKAYTESADVFSVAIVAWELFTGECPYEGMNNIEIAIMVSQGGSRLSIPSPCSQAQAEFLTKCWSSQAEDRPSSSDALASLQNAFPV